MARNSLLTPTIRLEDGLPFVTVSVTYGNQTITLDRTVLDTGSEGCVFSEVKLLEIGLRSDLFDKLRNVRGVGGTESVFIKRIKRLSLAHFYVEGFDIELGAMDYGFVIDGLIGIDFLKRVGAIIDLSAMTVR